MNPIPELMSSLKQLRLSGILDTLEARNREAIDRKLAYTDFLKSRSRRFDSTATVRRSLVATIARSTLCLCFASEGGRHAGAPASA